jgi:hypothetical protein
VHFTQYAWFRLLLGVRPIKARRHHGTKSLDLTIPATFCKEFNITQEDVFMPKAEKHNGKLIITYKRIFPESKSNGH